MVGAFPNLQPLLERHQERDAASLSEASMGVEFGLPNLRRLRMRASFEVPKGSLAAGEPCAEHPAVRFDLGPSAEAGNYSRNSPARRQLVLSAQLNLTSSSHWHLTGIS